VTRHQYIQSAAAADDCHALREIAHVVSRRWLLLCLAEPISGIAAGANRASQYDYVLFLIVLTFWCARGIADAPSGLTQSPMPMSGLKTESDRTAPSDGRRIHSSCRRSANHSHHRLQLLSNQFEDTFDTSAAADCQSPKCRTADEGGSRAKR
jgi:hypothetical protein